MRPCLVPPPNKLEGETSSVSKTKVATAGRLPICAFSPQEALDPAMLRKKEYSRVELDWIALLPLSNRWTRQRLLLFDMRFLILISRMTPISIDWMLDAGGWWQSRYEFGH